MLTATVLACLIAVPALADLISFSDGTFNDADWSSTVTGIAGFGDGTSLATTESSDGNPDAYRRISLTVAANQGVVNVQLFQNAVFTPSTQGAIQSVSLSYDVRRVFYGVIRQPDYERYGGQTRRGHSYSLRWYH